MGDQLKGGSGATPLNGQSHDVENGTHTHGPGKLLNLDTAVVAAPGQGNFWQRALWHGGSVYDAWLSATCAQVCTLYPHPGNTIHVTGSQVCSFFSDNWRTGTCEPCLPGSPNYSLFITHGDLFFGLCVICCRLGKWFWPCQLRMHKWGSSWASSSNSFTPHWESSLATCLHGSMWSTALGRRKKELTSASTSSR